MNKNDLQWYNDEQEVMGYKFHYLSLGPIIINYYLSISVNLSNIKKLDEAFQLERFTFRFPVDLLLCFVSIKFINI